MEAATALCSFVALILAFFFLTKRLLLSTKTSDLKLPPTIPWSLPLLGHLLLFKPPIHRTLASIAARHGPLLLLRLGSRLILLVTSPDIVEECFTKNDIIFANRPEVDTAKYLTYNFTTLGGAPYGPHWRNLRRFTTLQIFSTASIAAHSYIRSEEVHRLLRHLFRNPTHRVQIKTCIKDLLLNIMTRMFVGKRYAGENAEVGPEQGRRFFCILNEFFSLIEVSCPEDYLPFVRWLGMNGQKKRLEKLHKEMDELFQEMVDERRGRQEEEKRCLVDVMLDLQERDNEGYSDQVIKGVIQGVIAAGTETSAGAMEWAISLLLNNPITFKKLRREIETQVGHKRLLTDSDLPNLPYLNNVIKETLRLLPVAPLLLPHRSSSECNIRGYDIPTGTFLFVNVFAMNRDPTLWTEPTKFKPERFEEGEGEGYNFIPFGSGRRRCPGDALAIRVIGLTLGSLIQCFEWERVGEMEVDLTEVGVLSMCKAHPLQAIYKPHEDMINILSKL